MKVSVAFVEVDVNVKDRRARADNSGYHDARLLYTIDLASSRAHYGTPLMEARDDVIPADVSRHCPYSKKQSTSARTLKR